MSFDSQEKNAAFASKHDFPFPLLCDTERKIGLAYKACESAEDQYARRYTYLIGPDGQIEQAIDTKNPGAQASEILTKLS